MSMISGTHRNSVQERVVYGRPALEALSELAASFGAKRLLLTTTGSLGNAAGLATRLAKELGSLCTGVFAGITAHSPREAVIEGAAMARRLESDLLIAVGGGSVIDATKAMQLALWGGVERAADLSNYRVGAARADAMELTPTVRMVAIPTTLSAAEFTPFAGILNVEAHAKERYTHALLAPRAVVLDPAMTVQTPPKLWFSTGMKAVDHAVETLCNPVRAPFADALAEAGLTHLAAGLRASHFKPQDPEVRLTCQIGMWLAMAGASSGRGIGASHAIGHTLGAMFGVPHGITSCVALPAVLRWNQEVNADRQRRVAELLGKPEVTAAAAVKSLAEGFGLPTTLAAIGIGPERFRAIAEHTMHDRGVRMNPRPINAAEDIVSILQLSAA
jgi:maleylacetate reductase